MHKITYRIPHEQTRNKQHRSALSPKGRKLTKNIRILHSRLLFLYSSTLRTRSTLQFKKERANNLIY